MKSACVYTKKKSRENPPRKMKTKINGGRKKATEPFIFHKILGIQVDEKRI